MIELIHGDCLEEMRKIPDESIDLVLTDPPYELGFMGKSWDSTGIANNVEMWREALRVLKPGGYLLSFGGTRTYHRMASAIEDAGFEVRDMIEWVYGSGFPKSLNIGKAINKIDGVEFESKPADVVGFMNNDKEDGYHPTINQLIQKGESSDRAKQWEGWGTALKPAHEPICMARKPLSEKTVAENCLKWGTGGINVDGCRVKSDDWDEKTVLGKYRGSNVGKDSPTNAFGVGEIKCTSPDSTLIGRFPANLIHDNSEEVRECFPETKSGKMKEGQTRNSKPLFGSDSDNIHETIGDSGNASRFFKSIVYTAKASKSERNNGCEGLEEKQYSHDGRKKEIENPYQRNKSVATNNHPTVKPTKLMEYLVTMASREGATILDPFMGSGTTGVACKNLNRNFIGIELDEEYFKIAKSRIGI